jgi:FMN phosphatase YigB (HAD superfamily)
MKPPRTIVFDFGNVIGFFDHRRATRRISEHTGISEAILLARVMDPILEDEYEKGAITSAEFLRRVKKSVDITLADELLGDAYSDIFSANEPVCALVPRLKGRYRLVLGSNTTELHSNRFRTQFADTLSHFDVLVLSHEIGVRKPNRGFFDHCQKVANCSAGECLFIDDLVANVDGAKACGWQGIVYRSGDDLHQQLRALNVELSDPA